MSYKVIKRERPDWIAPLNDGDLPPLMIYNSLTNEKNLFKPKNGNKVQWYGCGPTVYDVSHMGHARTYISIDIIRRIMKDYLFFDINYVMNITDIDDKIIKRARQNHLYDKYIAEEKVSKEDVEDVLRFCEKRLLNEKDEDMKEMLSKEHITVLSLLNNSKSNDIQKRDLIMIKDALSSWLDKHRGHTVTENVIFETLPRQFEEMFHRDMRDLNILPPDHLTRVSEYIPQIVAFIVKILERDLAYESNGSIYFDTDKFARSDSHYYAKLVPSAYGNDSLLQEGEGALSTVEIGEKRSSNDFALWKASKKGEPSWESPWGMGRPGWHIECSAMAGDKCGSNLDIHTGGVDLKFPHHDNELAQSEAHYGCAQWVNYFLHTGHLTISGCKMSKSLKNFISIRDALSRYSWRQLRFAFLMSSWKDTLDYSDDLMTAAIVYEKMLLDFFFNMNSAINLKNEDISQRNENNLNKLLEDSKNNFYKAICDSFDTRECMTIVKKLVEEANKHYISNPITSLDVDALRAINSYVYNMMKMFGAAEVGPSIDLIQYNDKELLKTVFNIIKLSKEFEEKIRSSFNDDNKDIMEGLFGDFRKNMEDRCSIDVDQDFSYERTFSREEVDVILYYLAELRQSVRSCSRQKKWKSLLTLCDELRDKDLVLIGVRFQDLVNDMTAVGLYPSWAVGDDLKKVTVKEKKVLVSGDKGVKSKMEANVDPKLMFTAGRYEGLYSHYDETGLPTFTIDGKEVSKTQKGKLKKSQTEQEKKYKTYNEQK